MKITISQFPCSREKKIDKIFKNFLLKYIISERHVGWEEGDIFKLHVLKKGWLICGGDFLSTPAITGHSNFERDPLRRVRKEYSEKI